MNQHVFKLLWAAALLLSVANANAFYNPQTGRWLNRDPLTDIAVYNQYIQTRDSRVERQSLARQSFNNPHLFSLNDPLDKLDADGAAVPVLLIFTTGKASRNGILACYDCYQLRKCMERSGATARQAAEKLTEAEDYLEWVKAAKPGQECAELLAA